MKLILKMFMIVTLLLVPVQSLAVTTTPTPEPMQYGEGERPFDTGMMAEPGSGTQIDPDMGIVPPDTGIMPPTQDSMGFLGQDQYYTVNFRGNGEAVVSMKSIFSNLGQTPLTNISYTFNKGVPSDIIVYQLEREKQCIRYEESAPNSVTKPACVEYQEPNYYDYWYGQSRYYKAEASVEGNLIQITLPRPVSSNSSASIVVYYRTPEYTSKTFTGSYTYSFESLKTTDQVRNLQIGIITDNDWQLKGATGNVQYGADVPVMAKLSMESVDRSVLSGQMDSFYQQIGYGSIVKNASNLQADETYIVTGEYAKNIIQLYGLEIIGAVVFAIIIISLIGLAIRFILRKLSSPVQNKRSASVVIVAATSFVSALIIGLVTAMAFALTLLFNFIYVPYQVQGLFMLVLSVITIGIMLFFFVVPALVAGIKRGLWIGIATAASTVAWLMLFGVIALIASSFFILYRNEVPAFGLGVGTMKSEPFIERQPAVMEMAR